MDRTEATEQVEVWTAAANTGKAETAQDSKIGEQDAAHNMLGINDTLPMRTIRQMVACTDQLVTDQVVPGISGQFLSGQLGLSGEAVDAMHVSGELLKDEVYHNTAGENEMEKWREKPTVEKELGFVPMESSLKYRTRQQRACERENQSPVASSIPEFLGESSTEPMNGQNSEQGGNHQLFVWPPPAKDTQQHYERPETALHYLNQRLSEKYELGRARTSTLELHLAAIEDGFNGPQIGAHRVNEHGQGAKTWPSGEGYQPCDFDGLTPSLAI